MQFLGHMLRVPIEPGMNAYIASVQNTLTDLDHRITGSTADWKNCATNVGSRKCRTLARDATELGTTAKNILQNLRTENERLLNMNKGGNASRAECLSCVRSGLNRIFFSLLPNYWLSFGLNFGGIHINQMIFNLI